MMFDSEWTAVTLGLSSEIAIKILNSFLILLTAWMIRFLIGQFIDRRVEDLRTRHAWRKTSAYVTAFIALILIAWQWLAGIQTIVTYLGLLSAGLAIALQGPLSDLAGWVFLVWRKPFEIGDRIEIGDHAGDVVDIRIFQFTLLEIGNWVHADQSTGRILHIPNKKLFSDPVANYNKGFEYIWHEIEVLLTFESNWEKARAILEEIASRDATSLSEDAAERLRRASRRFVIVYQKLTPIVYMRVASSGILFTLRYLCDPRRRRSTEQTIWEDILREFAPQPDIEFAYPTQRFYSRQFEPKVPVPPVSQANQDGSYP